MVGLGIHVQQAYMKRERYCELHISSDRDVDKYAVQAGAAYGIASLPLKA